MTGHKIETKWSEAALSAIREDGMVGGPGWDAVLEEVELTGLQINALAVFVST